LKTVVRCAYLTAYGRAVKFYLKSYFSENENINENTKYSMPKVGVFLF